MDKQVVFKTNAFGGFDKKAVLDYVYELNQRAEEAQAQLEERIQTIAQEKEDLERQLREAQAEVQTIKRSQDSVQAELSGERMRISELNELIANLNDEIEQQKTYAQEKENEVTEFARLNVEYTEKNKQLEKSRIEVDQASAQIGKLLIEAHADAENILREAHSNASAVVAQAKSKAEEILSDAGVQARRSIEDAEVQSRRSIEEAEGQARAKIDAAQRAVDAAYEKFSVFRAEVSSLQRVMLNTLEDIHFKAGAINEAINSAQDTIHQAGTSIIDPDDEAAYADFLEAAEEADDSNPADGPFFRYAADEE